MLDRADFLRTDLLLDVARCVATGAVMTLATPASSMTLIAGSILRLAGLSLFRIAAVSALVAVRRPPPLAGVWLVILGNAAWAVGSFVLLFDGGIAPNAAGVAFVALQTIAVALLAELEFMGLRRMPARA